MEIKEQAGIKSRDAVIVRTSIIGILANVFLAAFKAVVGLASNSIAIPAKIRMMYYMPTREEGKYPFVGFSREECAAFLDRSVDLAVRAIEETRSLMDNKRMCDSGAVQDPVL